MKSIKTLVLTLLVLSLGSLCYAGNNHIINKTHEDTMVSNTSDVNMVIASNIISGNNNAFSPLLVAYNPCPGSLTCMTYTCGGTDRNPYVCCPIGAPYLNNCDCKCYSSSDFQCMSYTYCRRRW